MEKLKKLISMIELVQLEKEIRLNPQTKFESKDTESINNGDLNVIVHVAELYAIGSSVIHPNPQIVYRLDGYGLLGDFYEYGVGVEKDYHLSLTTLLEGAKKGSPTQH